jgi:hypothetical protein
MRSSLFASVDIIEFQTTDAYSSLDLTNVIYNVSIHSRDGKLKVILLIIIIILKLIPGKERERTRHIVTESRW